MLVVDLQYLLRAQLWFGLPHFLSVGWGFWLLFSSSPWMIPNNIPRMGWFRQLSLTMELHLPWTLSELLGAWFPLCAIFLTWKEGVQVPLFMKCFGCGSSVVVSSHH